MLYFKLCMSVNVFAVLYLSNNVGSNKVLKKEKINSNNSGVSCSQRGVLTGDEF